MPYEFRTATLSRRIVLRGSGIAGIGLFSPLPALAQTIDPGPVDQWPSTAAMLRSYVEQGRVANTVAALGWGEDAPDYLRFGRLSFTSDTPAGPDSLYRIYSMTKPITGMAAMMCIEDGLMALDQPLAEILPAFADMLVQKVYDGTITPDNLEPAVRPITIRHLLTHTAGLGYSIVQDGPISEAYSENGLVPGQVSRLRIPGLFRAPAVESLEVFADRLAQMPLVYQPGHRWSYSVGLDLMGRVIEVVSGQRFDDFLQRRIFGPLGMDSTFFRVPESEVGRFTANYFVLDGTLIPVDLADSSVYLDDPAFPFGGAGLVSSARDYDRFLAMLANGGALDGERVMSEASVRLATSDLMPDTLAANGGFRFGEMDFGFGAGGLAGRGIAEGLYGWFGAAGTCGLVNMRQGLRHTLMIQYMPAEAYPVYQQFPLAVAQDAASARRG